MESMNDNGGSKEPQEKKEYEAFYDVIHHYDDMNLVLAVMPDHLVTKFYNFMLWFASMESEKGKKQDTPKMKKIKDTISSLEQTPAVQNYLWESTKEKDEIDEIVALIEERQKVRKMGPIRKYVYKKTKKKRM